MKLTARPIFPLLLALTVTLAGGLRAQEAPAPPPAATETAAEISEGPESAAAERHFELQGRFTRLLERHPDELWMILKLDPALLTNQAFLSGYPEIQEFLARHPEILKNPRFYLAHFSNPTQDGSGLESLFEMLAVCGGIGLTVFALGWLIRTLIEQKRWKQLSRTQNEVHNKLLDRFGTSEQLIEYIRSPAGSKFLESAPIPLHVERPASGKTSRLAARILGSVQVGVMAAVLGLGMLLFGTFFDQDSSQGLLALGAIALCVGAGFIASATVSLRLSRRLGLWEEGS